MNLNMIKIIKYMFIFIIFVYICSMFKNMNTDDSIYIYEDLGIYTLNLRKINDLTSEEAGKYEFIYGAYIELTSIVGYKTYYHNEYIFFDTKEEMYNYAKVNSEIYKRVYSNYGAQNPPVFLNVGEEIGNEILYYSPNRGIVFLIAIVLMAGINIMFPKLRGI